MLIDWILEAKRFDWMMGRMTGMSVGMFVSWHLKFREVTSKRILSFRSIK
jgi:hypothetical protein